MHGGFAAERTKVPGALKIGAAISGSRIAGENYYGHEASSDIWAVDMLRSVRDSDLGVKIIAALQ